MAARKKAKARKTVVRRGRAKGTARKARSPQQTLRARIQKRMDAKLGGAMKLARALEQQGVAPDEIAARVRSELAGLGADVMDDVLKLAGEGIWVQSGGEA